jgi:uncharacterized protein YndB with AHSA1/START domain
MTTTPVIIERVYHAPSEKVWKAIAEKEQMKLWYLDLAVFEAKVGFEFSFVGGPKSFVHLCKVMEVIPGKKLAYSWRFEGFEGDSLVSFELFPEGENTRIRLTHSGIETFFKPMGFDRNNFEPGWAYLLDTQLKEFVEKQ